MKIDVLFSVSLMLLSIFIDGSLSKLERVEHPVTKPDGSLSFLVVGDWGRKGEFNQSRVAQQMGIVGEQLDIDYVISVGDNFYDDGLKSDNDTSFEASFSNIYTHPSLQKQWYSVLGNHDYRGNVEAQLSHVLTQKDWRWFCRRSFVLSSGMVEFFFVDTNPFVEKYFTEPGDHVYDWSHVLPRDKYISNLLHDLDVEIKKSCAKWKFVVGHHGIKTAGHHGPTQELVDQLVPILEREIKRFGGPSASVRSTVEFNDSVKAGEQQTHAKIVTGETVLPGDEDDERERMVIASVSSQRLYDLVSDPVKKLLVTSFGLDSSIPSKENKVDLYINGHDHCLQHIGSNGETKYLTSGGGSKAWKGDIKPWDPKELKLYYDGQGFMSLHVTRSQLSFIFYDVSGNVLHQSTLSKKSNRFYLF